MDSLTQIALGAAVGEAVLGKKVGYRAALWGSVFGTLPDLDILAYPFLTEVQELAFHRGMTHALLFSVVVAPLVGPLLARWHRKLGVPWQSWAWMVFWILFTHPILDAFTSYGTQLLWPITMYPVAFSTLSIIDLLYTVPLLVGVIIAISSRRASKWRAWSNRLGLGISTFYLLVTIGVKLHAMSVFNQAFEDEGIAVQQTMVVPALLNSMLWVGMADDGEAIWVGTYSIWDDDTHVPLQRIDKRTELLAPFVGQPPAERLLWFSKGFYTMVEVEGNLIFNDMHIGRGDLWLEDDGPYIFSFKLVKDPNDASRVVGIEQQSQAFSASSDIFQRYWQRIWGHR